MAFVPTKFDQLKEERYEEMIKQIIDESDIILVVLDARMPIISRNSRIEELLKEKGKKFTFVLNKIDLALKKDVKAAKKKLIKIAPTLEVSSKTGQYIDALSRRIFSQLDKIKKARRKVGLLGYPNVGKSSIINRLTKRGAAKVSKEAGFTKGIHWIRGKKMELVDGPGYIESKEKLEQLRMGFLGAKNPEKLRDPESIAVKIIEVLLRKRAKSIEETYKVKPDMKSAYETLLKIGKRYGHLKKGGDVEERKTAIMVIRDWQRGKLKFF